MDEVKERVKITVEVDVDINYLAEQFAALSDDAQAQWFCLVAEKLGTEVARDTQALAIGRHLARCGCSTEAGREFVRVIIESMASART